MGLEITRHKLEDKTTLFVIHHYPVTLALTENEFEHLCRQGLRALSDDFNEKRDVSLEVTGENKNVKKT